MSDFDAGQIRARLRIAARLAKRGANRGVKLGAEHLLGESNKLVPIEEATLLQSGKVSTNPAGIEAAVSYGTPYAVIQHEDLTFKHDPGRQAKYLETPMNTERPVILALVGREIKTEMGL